MSTSLKRWMCMAALMLAGLGLVRAAMTGFQQKQQALRVASRAELQKLGITRDAAKAKYPTPQISLVTSGCLTPGSTGEVIVKGKFAPETKFVFETDHVAVVKEALTPTEYRATVKVADGAGPHNAAVWAMTPVSGIETREPRGLVVGGRYEWNMDSNNGWKIVASAPSNKACGGPSTSEDQYEVVFYRKGETAPFEKRKASLYYSPYESTNYSFSISQQDPASTAQAEDMQKIMEKLVDPKLTDAQRDQLMKKIEKAQEQMMAGITKMQDPNYIKEQEAKRLQFGCERLSLVVPGPNYTGEMRCAQAVGVRVPVTGTLKFLGK